MKEKRAEPITLRPFAKTRERLEYAKSLGFGTAELVNLVLEKHLKDYLENAVAERRKALNAPVP